ncbi:MAG: DUF177 domain-containing protein [Hyphomicrobiales bacterium]|nr:DUF177 domain-containing protein [Hyphomicrobiales bacterium]MBV9740846.1 DUF177 domain-containing protein [Hyphomicrobiales bacterium]
MKKEPSLLRRDIAVADIPRPGLDIEVEANAQERAEIARCFNLVGIEALCGKFHVSTASRGARVRGEVTAKLRQTCVVSLDAFDAELKEPVDLAFAHEGKTADLHAGQIDISPDDEDPPEPIVDGKIDLGAVTLEFLALGLDAHPRKPGVSFTHKNNEAERPASPFAVLARRPGKPPSSS